MSKESAMAKIVGNVPLNTAETPAPVETKETPGVAPAEVKVDEPKELESSRFAHLAKKEAQLVKEREAFKKEQESIKVEKQKMLDIKKKIDSFEEMKVKDPVSALKTLGFTETDIFNFLSQGEPKELTTEEKAAQAAQAEIKKFKDEEAKKASDAEKAKDEATIKRFKTSITTTLSSNPEKFEYCNYHGPLAEELIYNTVEAVLKEDGELISTEEAAELVESFYEEQDRAMSSLKKRKPKETPVVEANETPEAPPKSKTITSRVAPTVASTIPKKETSSEKRERLINQVKQYGLKR